MWSKSPLDTIVLTDEDLWVDMPNTFVHVVLDESSPVFVTYEALVIANKPAVPGGDVLPNNGQTEGFYDAVACRVTIDGVAYRQSGSKTTARMAAEVDSSVVAGHLITTLSAGNHTVQLQWKKIGSAVRSWTIDETIDDGFHGGRTITATSPSKYLWYTQPLTGTSIASESEWLSVEDMTVEFELAEKATLRFMYHIPVRPDFVPNDDGKTMKKLA